MAEPSRQDDEHRLAKLVSDWIAARSQKADAIKEHNEVIKTLEDAIEQLAAMIQGGQYQTSLPFGDGDKPAIALDETDPDAQAAKDCSSCGHLRVYHESEGCIQPECECKVFTTLLTTPPDESQTDAEDPTVCLHCGHPEGVHGTTRKRGCMRAECDCKGYVHPDPLGIADAEPEKREAEL